VSEREWTLAESTELCLEQAFDLLDGCDDEDMVRPALVLEAMATVWAPRLIWEPIPVVSAGLLRERLRLARHRLAAGKLR
jgi:hypothetical protein